MTRNYDTLLLNDPADHVLLVTLNRPQVANAFNTQMAMDLMNLFEGLNINPAETRAVVVTGSGTRAFCAGGDLKERNTLDDAAWRRQHLILAQFALAMHTGLQEGYQRLRPGRRAVFDVSEELQGETI